MKKYTRLLQSLTLIIALLFYTACSDKKMESESNIELSYWSMWNETEPQAMVLKEAIKDFEMLNPNVKIRIQWNGREIRKTLQPALDAGTKIDIWDEDLERIVKTWQDYALPLDDYYKQSYDSTEGQSFENRVMPSLQSLLKELSSDGLLYGVPYQPMVIVVFYNKVHFKEAGINETPQTWDDFLKVSLSLKNKGFTPITIDDAYIDLPLAMHLNRIYGDYNKIESLVKDKSGKLWDDPRILKAAKDFENLAPYMSRQVADNKWPAGQQEVATDQVSMYLTNGTWLPNEVMGTTGPEFQWGQFSYPTIVEGQNADIGIYGSQGFQINKNCTFPDEAFALLAHLTTGKWDKELASKTYGAPMDTSIPWPVQIEESRIVFENLERRIPWSGGLAADSDSFPIIKSEFTSLLAGQITAEQFVENVKSGIK